MESALYWIFTLIGEVSESYLVLFQILQQLVWKSRMCIHPFHEVIYVICNLHPKLTVIYEVCMLVPLLVFAKLCQHENKQFIAYLMKIKQLHRKLKFNSAFLTVHGLKSFSNLPRSEMSIFPWGTIFSLYIWCSWM